MSQRVTHPQVSGKVMRRSCPVAGVGSDRWTLGLTTALIDRQTDMSQDRSICLKIRCSRLGGALIISEVSELRGAGDQGEEFPANVVQIRNTHTELWPKD